MFPTHPRDISRKWLTHTLRTAGILFQACVIELQTDLLGADKGTTGHIVRLQLRYDHEEPHTPRALIAKFSAFDPQERALVHGMGFYEREVCFYQQMAQHNLLRTPRCYFSALEPSDGTSLLLLEDLVDARNASRVAGCSGAEAELVVRAIAPFHAAWWQHPDLADKNWLELRSFVSVQQVPRIVEQLWEPFLAKLGQHVTTEVLQLGVWLKRYLHQLCASLYQQAPSTLIHNDYQGDNLFFAGQPPNESLIVVDWQLITRGRGVLDVAYFLSGNLDPVVRREHERHLLHTYHTLLIDNGVRGYSFEQCWNDYRLATILLFSRIVTVVGLGAVPSEQEQGYYEVLVPRYCRAAHELMVGEMLEAAFSSRV